MNALIAQCGGPAPVLNATLAGALGGCSGVTNHTYGARFGLQGLVQGDWVDLTDLSTADAARLAVQAGAALGGGRYALRPGDLAQAAATLRARAVSIVLLIGGNGTMAAAHALAQAAPDLRVLGVPKTVDNDIAHTHVTPGYASAARYVVQSVYDAALDLRAMATFEGVTVLETMGRHTGWLAAAAALARTLPDDPPHLILLPEAAINEDDLLAQIAALRAARGCCVVVAAEGACDDQGRYLAEKMGSGGTDDRGQPILSMGAGVAAYLAVRIQRDLGLRCRALRPNSLQRATSLLQVEADRALARDVGRAAARYAGDGLSDVMVGIVHSEAGGWNDAPVLLADVVGQTRTLPAHFIAPGGLDLTPAFLAYAQPLIGPPPPPPLLWV